jgi:glycerophosphoryl diester phosphodiesterase
VRPLPFYRPVSRAGRPLVVAHRGGPRLDPADMVKSLTLLCASGVPWVELDLRRSGDGTLFVAHSPVDADHIPVVERDTPALTAGGVVRLADLLAGVPRRLGLCLEIKNRPGEPDYEPRTPSVALLAETLRDAVGTRPLMTCSFDRTAVSELAAIDGVPTGLLHDADLSLEDASSLALEVDAAVLCPNVSAAGLDAASVERVHAAGLQLMAWPANDVTTASRLARAGVDAICTDVAEHILESFDALDSTPKPVVAGARSPS